MVIKKSCVLCKRFIPILMHHKICASCRLEIFFDVAKSFKEDFVRFQEQLSKGDL